MAKWARRGSARRWPQAGCVQLEYERGDIPGVVLAAVMPALQGKPGDPQRPRHAWPGAQAVRTGEHRLGIDMARAERELGAGRAVVEI